MCATLGRGAPRVPGAPRARGTPGAQAYQARLVRHVRGTRRVCQVRLRTWRHTSEPCRPPPSLSKTNAQSRRGGHHGVWWACTHQAICQHPRRPFQKPLDRDHGVAARDPDLAAKFILNRFFDRDGGPAHSRQHAGTPAVPVKKQYKVLAGLTSMTHFSPKCTLYCFLTGMVGGGASGWLRMLRIWRQRVLCIVFYKRWLGGPLMVALFGSWLAAGRLGEGVFTNREQ